MIGDDFTSKHQGGGNGLVGLGYFINNQIANSWQISYGINGFYLPKTPISGTVVQENLFTNLAYGYHVTHYPIYAVAKINTPLVANRTSLSVDAGIGPNFMRTSDFTEYSLDGGITIPDRIFSGHTSITFGATAGIGIQVAEVFGDAPLECGYRFYYLGQGRLRRINTQVINTLHTGSIYGNVVLCALHI